MALSPSTWGEEGRGREGENGKERRGHKKRKEAKEVWSRWERLGLALSSIGPVRFISDIKGLSPHSSPIHQGPVWGLCASRSRDGSWGHGLEAWRAAGRMTERGGRGTGRGRLRLQARGTVARVRRPEASSVVWGPRVQRYPRSPVSHWWS